MNIFFPKFSEITRPDYDRLYHTKYIHTQPHTQTHTQTHMHTHIYLCLFIHYVFIISIISEEEL